MTARQLALVDTATGERVEPGACPQCEESQAVVEELTKKYKGLLLENRTLKRNKVAELLDAPERPQADLLHAVWKVACKRRRDLDLRDYERMNAMVRKHGLGKCLQAVAGAAFDPGLSPPRRNGTRKRYDDLELIFRETAKVEDFAERVPEGWTPDVAKIATISGAPEGWIEELLR